MVGTFSLLSAFGAGAVVTRAAVHRGRPFAFFAGVMLGVHTLLSAAMAPTTSWLLLPYAYAQGAVYTHFFLLAKPYLKGLPYRALVSIPGQWFAASTFLALPWAVSAAAGVALPGAWIPYALGTIGLLDSLFGKEETLELQLDGSSVETLQRMSPVPASKAEHSAESDPALRVVQLTDPHLGPFMSVAQLREQCERVVERQPDLVLLTGDFLTMEAHADPAWLTEALAPLKALQGKTFACLGNHDHEAPHTVRTALEENGIQLLVDRCVTVETRVGPVEILGFDFLWRDRARRMKAVCDRFPRTDGVPRLALLHDPGAFQHLPEGAADLVFSGHTHGGQVGLLRLGLPHTVVSMLSSMPDHGLWGRGRERLYVHRGTGHYGFPLRVGVPSERSLLRVLFPKEKSQEN